MATNPNAAGSRYLFTGVAVASIWLAVVLASIFAPDMVTGSQHEHLQIAAYADWLWGAFATGFVLLRAAASGVNRRADVASRNLRMALTMSVGIVWLAVLLVSIFTPQLVIGTDPTRLPVAAMFSPIFGVIVTAYIVCLWPDCRPGNRPELD